MLNVTDYAPLGLRNVAQYFHMARTDLLEGVGVC